MSQEICQKKVFPGTGNLFSHSAMAPLEVLIETQKF